MSADGGMEPWVHPIHDRMSRGRGEGGLIVCLPEYRPDLARNLAYALDLSFMDFRQEFMTPLGWQAHALGLDRLSEALHEHAQSHGLVAFNVEALLATKPVELRTGWLRAFLVIPFPNPVLVVLCVYGEEAPRGDPRVFRPGADQLPTQGLVNRLAL